MDASDLSLKHLQNTAASHDEILSFGRPANPINFPDPQFSAVTRVNASVHNPNTGETLVVTNVFYEVKPDGRPPLRAYWIGRRLKRAIYGCVRSCQVLRLREGGWAGPHGNSFWEITAEMAAVKIIDLNSVRELRGRHIEDPLKEVAAMQSLCRNGAQPNVLPCWDLFKDDRYIYLCMPFCSKGELFGFVERSGRFEEPVARFWFAQLLNVRKLVVIFVSVLTCIILTWVTTTLNDETVFSYHHHLFYRRCIICKRMVFVIEIFHSKIS